MSNHPSDAEQSEIVVTDFDEFQVIVDKFIERSSREFGEMPASVFFELLLERMAEQTAEKEC